MPSAIFILMQFRLTSGMADGIAEDSDTWNGLKRAVGGTIHEKGDSWGFERPEKQISKYTNTFGGM